MPEKFEKKKFVFNSHSLTEENRPKTQFFVGKRHDNTILKVQIGLSRNLLSLCRLLEEVAPKQAMLGCLGFLKQFELQEACSISIIEFKFSVQGTTQT